MPRLVRTPLTWLIYVQLGLYAYFLYGFGPIVGFLRDEQGTSNALASLHSTGLAVGAMAGGALFPLLSRAFGRGRVMWGSLAGIALAVLGFVVLPPMYPVTLSLTALIGFFGICVVSCVVVSLSQMHGAAGSAAISEANAMAVAAGLAAPLVIGLTVDAGWGWRAGVGVLIGLIGLVALIAWRMRIEPPHIDEVSTVDTAEPKRPLPKAYWLAWTMMVMTGAVEITLSLWTAIVLREELAFSPAAASAAVSAIVGGMLVGRTLGARLALRMGAVPLYFGALVLSFVGFTLFWMSGNAIGAIAGLLLVGLGNAMHYPLAIAIALAVVAPSQADRAAGVASYGMGLSFGVGPLLLGLLADKVGTHTALLLVPVFIAAAALLAWGLRGSVSSPQLGDRSAEVVEQMA
ncbi:MAG TPA: MFS transporter [Micromonosporaceae bacterium]|nr:MFS transporter [Micromonosporaceae bacterium]HCU50282.1 MFS transporter [Micromonosporaceae bacterium]